MSTVSHPLVVISMACGALLLALVLLPSIIRSWSAKVRARCTVPAAMTCSSASSQQHVDCVSAADELHDGNPRYSYPTVAYSFTPTDKDAVAYVASIFGTIDRGDRPRR